MTMALTDGNEVVAEGVISVVGNAEDGKVRYQCVFTVEEAGEYEGKLSFSHTNENYGAITTVQLTGIIINSQAE